MLKERIQGYKKFSEQVVHRKHCEAWISLGDLILAVLFPEERKQFFSDSL